MPVAGRGFPALGIRDKSRDRSYLSCFIKARVSCSNAILSGRIGVSLNAYGRSRPVLIDDSHGVNKFMANIKDSTRS